jgi:hypothetical protein
MLPPMPTPPATCNAPEFVPVLAVTFDITNVVVVPVPLADVPLTNGDPFKVTEPVELIAKVQVPDTNDEPVLTNMAVEDTLVQAPAAVL